MKFSIVLGNLIVYEVKIKMKRKWLAVGIILLFVGVTIAPTINFNTVKASQQNMIKERTIQKELLFQTICDIANNKEIQRIILKSQMSRGIFPPSEFPVITKNQLRQMYFSGLILSKFMSKSRIQSMIGTYQFNNWNIQQGINAVIESNLKLKQDITQLKDSECDCEKGEAPGEWKFPVACTILFSLLIMFNIVYAIQIIFFDGPLGQLFMEYLFIVLSILASIPFYLECYWIYPHG
jgi:hypothetical protein